jgi:hypothetical protein
MATHWLDRLAKAMGTPADRRRFLGQAGRAAVVVGTGAALAGGAASAPAATAASATRCCRYLCDGAAVGRRSPGQTSTLVWVTPAESCPELAGCEWLQRIELAAT